MKYFLISDTHLNHANISTYCDRPENFTELILKRWNERVRPEDTVIHLGDVAIGPRKHIAEQIRLLNGKKILVRGNHDLHSSVGWWADNGFDFACDGMVFKGCLLTHHPALSLPRSCKINIHGHLHNIWHGFTPNGRKPTEPHLPWHRLFAIEYTSYYPIRFDDFVSHPDRYQARGPKT